MSSPDVTGWGTPPPNVTHWSCYRESGTSDRGVLQTWAAPGAPLAMSEWPLSELTAEVVRERWGEGTYKIGWLKPEPTTGKLKFVTCGRTRVVPRLTPTASAPDAVTSSPAAASSLPPEWTQTFALMNVIEKMSDSKLTGLAKLAEIMAPRQASSNDNTAMIALLLDKQANMMRDSLAPIVAELQSVKAKLAEYEADEDGSSSAIGNAAGAVAGPALRGKGTLGNIAAHLVMSNPEIVGEVAKKGLETLGKVFDAVKHVNAQHVAPPQQAPQQAVRVPRARRLEEAAPPPPPPGPGLNGYMREQTEAPKVDAS